jgi:hypothetical protein
MNFVLTTAVGETLELAMLDRAYFLQEVSSRPLEELPQQPGIYRCECLLAQNSPFDPETGVWRRVEVVLRRKGREYEIYHVKGLKIRRETPSSG